MNVLLEREGKVVWDVPIDSLPIMSGFPVAEAMDMIIKDVEPGETLKFYDFGNYLLEVKRDA